MAIAIDTIFDSNEGTTFKVTGTLFDEDDVVIPDAVINKVTIAIYDYTTEEVIRAEDTLTPIDGVVTTWLTKNEVRTINPTLRYEYRHIVLVADYGGTKRVVQHAYVRMHNVPNYVVEVV